MKLHSSLLGAVLFAANNGTGSTIANDGANGLAPSSQSVASDPIDTAAGNRQSDFKRTLKDFVKSTTTSMKKARELADMAMEHFIAHGDTVYFQAYTDAIKAHASNYVRLEALAAWAITFAPLTFDKGKWTKDKERAMAMDWENDKDVVVKKDDVLVRFADISFWEFMPEKKVEPLDAEALIAFIMGKLNSKKLATRVAGNASAEATLALLKSTLTPIKPVVLADASTGEAEGQQAA